MSDGCYRSDREVDDPPKVTIYAHQWDGARAEILRINSALAELRDAFQQLTDDFENAQAVRESQAQTIADLERWKREQLQVTAWWAEIDAYVRQHPSAVLGKSVSAEALRLLRERDAYNAAFNSTARALGINTQKR